MRSSFRVEAAHAIVRVGVGVSVSVGVVFGAVASRAHSGRFRGS